VAKCGCFKVVIARKRSEEAIQSFFVTVDCFAQPVIGSAFARPVARNDEEYYPLKTPLRSLKRSSGCGARTLGCADEAEGAVLSGVADATDTSEEELLHNSRTAGETGCDLSPPRNSVRNIGSLCTEATVVAG
jgi:hypothetical protein